MRIFIKITLVFLGLILFSGCMITQPEVPKVQKSTFIVMKTPVFRYADQGFVQTQGGLTKVEIYANGAAVMKLEISAGKICSGTGLFSCMGKAEFNQRYLSAHYPDDTFERIFRGEKIFGGTGLQTQKGGFGQRIVKEGFYHITYTVLNGSIVFRDTISSILIKVRNN